MATGTGGNIIVPGGRALWGNLTGQDILTSGSTSGLGPNGQPLGWFGTNPLQSGANWLDFLRMGGGTSYGPQSTTYQRSGFPLGEPGGAGLMGALYGSSYSPQFGQSAYDRFADSGNSYLRRFGTDVRVDPLHPNVALQPELDAQGNPVGFGQGVRQNPAYYSDTAKTLLLSPERSAGLRSAQLYGGRGPNGEPLTGVQSDIFKTASGLAQLQQGANPFLNDPATAANMQIYSELSSPFTRGNAADYMAAAAGAETGPMTSDIGSRYISQMQGLGNKYEEDLLNRMAAQGSKDLSLGLQDAQTTMSAMGLGRSGQAQSTGAGVWRDIQEKNALDRQQLMAQFAEANAGRTGNAVLNAQQAAQMANEARLARMNQAAMAGQQAYTGSMEASRAAQRGALQQGMANTLDWNQGNQQRLLQAMLGGDEAMRQRLQLESQGQSQGLADYMRLQQTKDAMRADRLNEMLGLEDRYMAMQNAAFNQMQTGAMYGPNALMQMITGIAPTGPNPARTSPWGMMAAQGGINYAGNLINQMGSGGFTSPGIDEKLF